MRHQEFFRKIRQIMQAMSIKSKTQNKQPVRHGVLVLFLLALLGVHAPLWADTFVIQNIRIEGLHGLSQGTVLSNLPIHAGESLDSSDSAAIVRALYQTGFFKNVQLFREGNTLVIRVQEFPTIGSLRFVGNKAIKTSDLQKGLDENDVRVGATFDPAKLQGLVQALQQQYYNLGYYDAKVTPQVIPESRNRVALVVTVNEGPIAKIQRIVFVGNHAFSTSQLTKQLSLSKPGLFSFLTHNDRFSQEKLDADVEKLHSFYLDYGYYNFTVVSKDVKLTPDHKGVIIILRINEGPQFTISGFKLNDSSGMYNKIYALITLKPGIVFSRKDIININDEITHFLTDQGYAFPTVQAVPVVDNATHTVFITFVVVPNQKVYVRRIYFTGNNFTTEQILRTELLQMEASIFSARDIDESKRRLLGLPFMRNVEAKPEHVEGYPNLVDLNFHVEEKSAAHATFQVGWSSVERFLYGINISDPNFAGTGRYVAIGFTRSQFSQQYSFTYNNPVFTADGISRGFSIYYNKYTPGSIGLANYTSDGGGASMSFGIPVSRRSALTVQGGFSQINLQVPDPASTQIKKFTDQYGTKFTEALISGAWNYSSLDRIIFPTHGSSASVQMTMDLPLNNKSLSYYTVVLNDNFYYPINKQGFILNLRGQFGYGGSFRNGQPFPFFANFFAGGLGTVPGFDGNSLGPQDTTITKVDDHTIITYSPIGGNILMVGNANLIFPNPFGDNWRTAFSLNAGNVYQGNIQLDNLRYSAGVMAAWLTPLGATLQFGIFKAMNTKAGDKISPFNFTIGASI